jgi:hypothetical protein
MRIKLLRPLIRMAHQRHHLRRPSSARSAGFSPATWCAVDATAPPEPTTQSVPTAQPPAEVLRAGDFLSGARLKSAGKICYFGISCETARCVVALQHQGIDALQLEISLLDTSALAEVVPSAPRAASP